MPTKAGRTGSPSKRNNKSRPSRATSDISDKHLAGLREVMAALRRELERSGEVLELREGADFSWRDIVPMPTESGAYLRLEFTGTTAAVIDAAVRVQHTFDILTGPLPMLLEELRVARAAMRSAWACASENGPEVTALIHNADMTRRAHVAFGAEPRDVPVFDFDAANNVLFAGISSADEFDALISSLEARMPDVITAGFYEPKGTGCVGQFAMLLSENGLKSPEIAEKLGQVLDRSAFDYLPTWKQKRSDAADNAKHLVNRAKAKLSKLESSGTNVASADVPPSPMTCVITRRNVGANQSIWAYVVGREAPKVEAAKANGGDAG